MMLNLKIKGSIIGTLLLTGLVGLSGCQSHYATSQTTYHTNPPISTTHSTTSVTWAEFVTLLEKGGHQSVGQQHDKKVRLILNNGNAVESYEPHLDDIYIILNRCKDCKNIRVVSE